MADDEWALRARLGRAFGLWDGGLDGPPPSVDELEAWATDAARLRDVEALRRLRRVIVALDDSRGEAAGRLLDVLRAARGLDRGLVAYVSEPLPPPDLPAYPPPRRPAEEAIAAIRVILGDSMDGFDVQAFIRERHGEAPEPRPLRSTPPSSGGGTSQPRRAHEHR